MKLTIFTPLSNTSQRSFSSIFAASASLWRKLWVVHTFGFCTLTLLMKALVLPIMVAAPSAQILIQIQSPLFKGGLVAQNHSLIWQFHTRDELISFYLQCQNIFLKAPLMKPHGNLVEKSWRKNVAWGVRGHAQCSIDSSVELVFRANEQVLSGRQSGGALTVTRSALMAL